MTTRQQQYNFTYAEYPELKDKISDLKKIIDNLDQNFKTIKELILEIAIVLEKLEICNKDEICRKIKEILKDEINLQKISARWIESCLPNKFVRKYRKNKMNESEVSSLSNKHQLLSLIQKDISNTSPVFDNRKDQLITSEDINKQTQNQRRNYDLELEGCILCKDVIDENKELKEIVKKNINFFTADRLKTEIKIPKLKIEDIIAEGKNCKEFIHIIIDLEGNITNIRADVDIDNCQHLIKSTEKIGNNDISGDSYN